MSVRKIRVRLKGQALIDATELRKALDFEDRKSRAYHSAFVDELMAGVRLLLEYYHFPKCLYSEMETSARRFFRATRERKICPNSHRMTVDLADLVARAKWFCEVPMAKLFNEPITPISDPVVWTRRVRRWFRARLLPTRETSKLWFSWFQLKRCTLVVPDEFVGLQAEKHRAAMSEPPEFSPDVERYRESLLEVLDLSGIRWNGEVVSKTPSRHACAENGFRSKDGARLGGAHWYLEKVIGEASLQGPVNNFVTLDHVGLYQGSVYERETPVFRCEARVDPEQLSNLLAEQADFDISGPIPARVEFVLEPLKVRTITKGPAGLYAYCSQWQKHVHSRMRQLDQFRLIGRPVREEDPLWARGPRERPGWEFISIDYRAATDKLNEALSQCMLALTVGRDVSPMMYDRLSRALGMHLVSYPPKMKLPDVQQANGQLMGSVMSFPILCLANASTITLTCQRWNQQVRRELLAMVGDGATLSMDRLASVMDKLIDNDMLGRFLVNGDDGLVYRPKGWRALHEQIAREAGLTYSVGKVYAHEHYANINSTGFWVKGDRCDQLDYIPVGLMRGHHKVSGGGEVTDFGFINGTAIWETDAEVVPEGAIGALERTLRACTERPCFAVGKFLSLNKDDLRKACGPRNLWIAIPHGGFGLVPPRGFRFTITDEQKRIAGACPLPVSSRPLPGPEIRKSGAVRKGEYWYIEKDIWAQPARTAKSIKKGPPITPVIGEGWAYEPKSWEEWELAHLPKTEPPRTWVESAFPALFATKRNTV